MQNDNREDHIRERAYQIWEKEGRPDGHHERHWQEASDEWSTAEAAYHKGGVASSDEGASSGIASDLQPGGTTPGGGSAPGADAMGASEKTRKSA